MIEKSIKNGIRIYQKRPRKDKNKSIIDNSNKIIKAIELFKSMVDNDREYYAKLNNNINLDWINDPDGYKEIAREADSNYMKNKNDIELKLVKDFITKTNNGTINNKNKAGNEFRKLKQKVTNDTLRQDLIKYLGRYLFGEDIEPQEKYEGSIPERVKARRQNNETDRDTQRTLVPQDFSINLDDFRYGEHYDELDEEDRELLRNMNKEGKGLKILTNKQMLNRLPI